MHFKQDQVIEFDNGVVYGIGRFKGISHNNIPVIGRGIILEVEWMADAWEHNRFVPEYSHISIEENHCKEQPND